MRRTCIHFALAIALTSAGVQATPRFDIVDLGTLGGTSSRATAINNLGQIVGQSQTVGGEYHAFLHASGSMTDLGTLGGTSSEATAINDRGEIAGTSRLGGDLSIGAFRYSGGTISALGVTAVADGTVVVTTLAVRGINERGQILICKISVDPEFFDALSYLYSDGKLQRLTELGYTFGINDRGQIVGSVAGNKTRILDRGKLISPGPLAKVSAWPFAINNKGQVAGTLLDDKNSAFFYADGSITQLRKAWAANLREFSARSLNEAGIVVGYRQVSDNRLQAFIYDGSIALPLQNLVFNLTPSSFRELNAATSINDRGEIVGYGVTSQNETHAFLLKPRTWLVVDGGTNRTTSAHQLRISGVAFGSATHVTYQIGKNSHSRRTTGTQNWHFRVELKPGRNNIRVLAFGPSGVDVANVIVRRR